MSEKTYTPEEVNLALTEARKAWDDCVRVRDAAPDMLEALKSASAFLTDLLKQGDDMAADAALYHIDQAIDKAEGRS